MFKDRRQFTTFAVLNAILILVALIAQWWWLIGLLLVMMASGLIYRFGWSRRHRRSGVIP